MSRAPETLPISVLYVEDDALVREAFAPHLQRMAAQVWVATDGESGWALYESSLPDLVITDVRMPGMDGLELARRIRATGRNTPVIITTAHGENDLLLEAIRSGINEFLLKPFETEPVAKLLEKYAFETELTRELERMRGLLVAYKRVVDGAFFFFRADRRFVLSYLNTYLCDRLECHDFELGGAPLKRLIGEDADAVVKALEGTGAWRGRVRLRRKDGKPLTAELTAVALHDGAGGVCEYAFMGQDVTELQTALEEKSQALSELNDTLKKRVERETKRRVETEILVSSIFENAQVGICLTDSEYRYVKVNKTYCDIYGYTEEELIGRPFTMVVPPEDRPQLEMLHDRFLQEEADEIAQEWTVHRKDGSTLFIYATAGRLQTAEGEVYKITTISDVTELKEAHNRQKEQESLLVQQSKLAAMGEMLGAIAHQWRQPLTAISGAVLNLNLKRELDMLDDDEFAQTLGDIERLTQRMSGTINDFMDFFRPGKERSRFELAQAVDEVLGLLSAQLTHRNINVEVSVEGVVIEGYKNELEQVLLNLLGNARDAFENKRIPTRLIRIYVSEYDWKYDIVIEDNAGGIDEKILPRIGEPYFTTKGPGKGTGIGLYMSRMIIQNSFGGEIVAGNTYDENRRRGAVFVVSIPKQSKESG